MKLHLGVVVVPEPSSHWDTYEVGTQLEKEYGLFSRFAQYNMNSIVKDLEESIGRAIDRLAEGRPSEAFQMGTQRIEQSFREFLDNETMAQLGIPGVPTKAALQGKSKRFKGGRGPRRPSFIDSGTLQKSFKAWVD